MKDQFESDSSRESHREKLAKALQDFIVEREPSSYIVLAFNRDTKMDVARRILSIFSMMVDRHCLGRDFANCRPNRFDYIATPEHVDSNFHWNLAGRLPSEMKGADPLFAQELFSAFWKRLCPSGTVKYLQVFDSKRLAEYITKEARFGGVLDDFVVATEFHREKTPPARPR